MVIVLKNVTGISGNWTEWIAEACLYFAIYAVQLPDIHITNVFYHLQKTSIA